MTHDPERSADQRSRATSGHVRHLLRAATGHLVDVAMPPMCATCEERIGTRDDLCPRCWRDVNFIRPPMCDRLGLPLTYATGTRTLSSAALADPPDYDRARAVALFTPVVRRLIHGFKYHDQHHARRLVGRWLAQAGAELLAEADVMVPVPLHPMRLLYRRYNQAAILAHELTRLTGVRVDATSLKRVKWTAPQAKRPSATERQTSMSGAFRIANGRHGQIAGRRIVLIDDVITTGATVNACARALRKAGAAQVDVLAIALVSRD